MNFKQAICAIGRNYAKFSGRARRAEYWYFQLFQLLVYVCGGIMAGIFAGLAEIFRPAADIYNSAAMDAGPGFLTIIFYIFAGIICLALFVFWAGSIVPNLSVGWRRFQDQNIPGWLVIIFFVLGFIPYFNCISGIVNIVFMVLPGTNGPNQYGPDPLGNGSSGNGGISGSFGNGEAGGGNNSSGAAGPAQMLWDIK